MPITISITRIGSALPSKGARAKRFPVPVGALDKARTAADVLAVVRKNAKRTHQPRGAKETHGQAIRRIVRAENNPRAREGAK